MNLSLKLILGVVAFAGIGSYLTAQTATTALRGSISDPSGAVVDGAGIDLKNLVTGQLITKRSDGKGEYVFSPIQPGEYLIKVSSSGLAEQTKQAQILVNQPATINFTLSIQASATTVGFESRRIGFRHQASDHARLGLSNSIWPRKGLLPIGQPAARCGDRRMAMVRPHPLDKRVAFQRD